MPSKKVWTSPEGVQIEMITYRTIRVDRVRDALTKYRSQDGSMPDSLSAFVLCAASTTDVVLPEVNVPDWAKWLHNLVKTPSWLGDLPQHYEGIELAPSEMTDYWWTAYQETRDVSHAAPPELQASEPLAPEPDPETGEISPEALNFTNDDTLNGGKSSTIMSLLTPVNRPAKRRKTT